MTWTQRDAAGGHGTATDTAAGAATAGAATAGAATAGAPARGAPGPAGAEADGGTRMPSGAALPAATDSVTGARAHGAPGRHAGPPGTGVLLPGIPAQARPAPAHAGTAVPTDTAPAPPEGSRAGVAAVPPEGSRAGEAPVHPEPPYPPTRTAAPPTPPSPVPAGAGDGDPAPVLTGGGAERPAKRHGGEDGAGPAVPVQTNALQALCRQVFGFRLAMIAVAAPFALVDAAPGLGERLVLTAVLVTVTLSCVLFRHWERFGPQLLRHPALLAGDTLCGALLLVAAGPDSTLACVSVCTPLLAGLCYGWRGAGCFASLQGLVLVVVTTTKALEPTLTEALLLPGLCVVTGAMGVSLRTLLFRFGAATQALASARARLAAAEAVEAERARLAREMHDSVAKTLHGVALVADGLARSAHRMDPAVVRRQAELVAGAARRAATQSRELLTDLRGERTPEAGCADVLTELTTLTDDFGRRTGVRTTYRRTGEPADPGLPPAVARHLLTITSEALENARRHARPRHVDVSAGVHGDLLRIRVRDDGRGLAPGTDLRQLCSEGHFGLLGMIERAESIGARIRIGPPGADRRGTEVRVELPLRGGETG